MLLDWHAQHDPHAHAADLFHPADGALLSGAALRHGSGSAAKAHFLAGAAPHTAADHGHSSAWSAFLASAKSSFKDEAKKEGGEKGKDDS
mmetsp:Transcript_19532/g.54995  ORF Transcript_19532/g.54995 Transcript_19532/m.54995 type:complete len:90 (+) Transcript_19532:66-335(+)